MVYKFCIAKPGLQGRAWALEISSQALDKGLSRACWLGLGFLGLGLAGLGLSGPARSSLYPNPTLTIYRTMFHTARIALYPLFVNTVVLLFALQRAVLPFSYINLYVYFITYSIKS